MTRRLTTIAIASVAFGLSFNPAFAGDTPAPKGTYDSAISPNHDSSMKSIAHSYPLAAPNNKPPETENTAEDSGSSRFPSGAPTGEDRDFAFIVSPYVWIPNVSGDVGLGDQGLQFDLDVGDLLDVFEFGGLIRGEVRHKSGWGFAADYVFADLGADVNIIIGDVEADIDASILEATVVRRVQAGDNPVDVYAGIRSWNADIEAAISIPFLDTTITTGDDWIDPIIGARYQHRISPRWRLLGQADIGGFGAGSDFTWNAVAGASYAAWDNTSFQVVYRILKVDRQSGDQANPVDLDLAIQGPLIGFAYQF